MSLIAWYPLNGTLEDKGINGNNLTNNGALEYRFGKIGKCYDTENGCLFSNDFNAVGETFSCSIWMKSKVNGIYGCMPFCLGTASGLEGFVDLAFNGQDSSGKWIVTWNSNDGNTNCFCTELLNKDTKYQFPVDGQWHHYLVTNNYAEGVATLYVDGNEVAYALAKKVTTNKLVIGDYITERQAYPFMGYLNDFRVYDHILSLAEIKEIYKTPILKYSFDYPTIDPNIATQVNTDFSDILTGYQNKAKKVATVTYDNSYVVDGNYITISYDITIQDLTFVEEQTPMINVMSYNYTLSNEENYNNLITRYDIYGKSRQIGGLTEEEINLAENGTYHIVRTYQLSNTANIGRDWTINMRVDYINGGSVTLENFKTVIGKSEIKYDGTDGLIFDESGFGNDGTLYGEANFLTTAYSTDSKIGEGCYLSKVKTDLGASTYGAIETNSPFYEVPEITISFWLYLNEYKGTEVDALLLGQSPLSDNYGIWVSLHTEQMILGASIYTTGLVGLTKLEIGKWYNIVITAQKIGKIRIYINGQLDREGTVPAGLDWNDGALTIGDIRLNRNLSFDGKIDDLIIYATILSEEEIEKQYKERVKIDNKGNLFCKELTEQNIEEMKITGRGQTTYSSFDEGYDVAKVIKSKDIFETNKIYEI